MPANLLFGKDMAWVDLSAVLVDFLAIDTGAASPRFEMETNASEVGKHVFTPRALNIFANVDGGLEMLAMKGQFKCNLHIFAGDQPD